LGENQDIGEKKVVVTDESIGVSQLLGERVSRLPPKSTPMPWSRILNNRQNWSNDQRPNSMALEVLALIYQSIAVNLQKWLR